LYRNAEHYADPTAGAAFAHIAYEERMARRRAAQEKKKAEEKKKAAQRKLKREQEREKRRREREWRDAHTTWVKAWPREDK